MVLYYIALLLITFFLFRQFLFPSLHLRLHLPFISHDDPTDPTVKDLTANGSTPRRVTLTQIYPLDENIDTDVDVIAIHGFDTRSSETWTWKTASSEGVNWLSKGDMLPSVVKSGRIFTCDWPSDLWENSDFTQKSFDEFARLLLAGIAARHRAANQAAFEERPILFIASCLGGVVLMKALVRASPEYESVQRAVGGIVFLATPFSGTSFRDVAEWSLPGLHTWALFRAEKVSNLIHQTKLNSELLQLRRDFVAYCGKSINPVCLAAFYEKGKTSLPRKIFPYLPSFLALKKPLVDEESATLDVIPTPLPLDRVHVLMNKFPASNDQDFGTVAGRVRDILQHIRSAVTPDSYINNNCYTVGKLGIERISGDMLPMERCYVNLVIIAGSSQKDKHLRQHASQTSQFSLANRLNIETPETDLQIALEHLFGQPNIESEQIPPPKRILIRGHAGVGKSTLCKKIVHDFKQHGMWRDKFARILWVPLRNLKSSNSSTCNLETMLYEGYFSQTPFGRGFARTLWKRLEEEMYQRTLFILDGLDEVYQGLEENHRLFDLLKTLLNLPTVIVTSRPHVLLPSHLAPMFDLELETIGFYPEQVALYMENALTIKGDGRPDRRKIDDLQSLLRRHQLLQGLVRIPIQLDALCYIWGGSSSNISTLDTMTGIYQAIVKMLWEKDTIRLEKKHDGEAVAKTEIRDASLENIERIVSAELSCLEILAFTGMVHDVISFTARDFNSIQNSEATQILPQRTLPRLSFLRSSDPSSKYPIFHFLHLTFQEYFAARYFVRRWKADKPLSLSNGEPFQQVKKVEQFVADYKYDTRYNIFWRFVAGLLGIKGKTIAKFFQLIGAEPLDLIGPVHQRLVMHCMSEVPSNQTAFSMGRRNLEDQLDRWLMFECESRPQPVLAGEMELPEALIRRRLEMVPLEKRHKLVEPLRNRHTISPQISKLLCSWLQEDVGGELKVAILGVLQPQQGSLNDEILEAIAAHIRYGEHVGDGALKALERWPSPINNTSALLAVARLTEDEEYIGSRAIALLEKQPRLDDNVVDILVVNLQKRSNLTKGTGRSRIAWTSNDLSRYSESCLQQTMIETILHQPQPSKEAIRVVTAQLQSVHDDVRSAAVRSLHLHPYLSDDILQIVSGFLADCNKLTRMAVLELLKCWPQADNRILHIVKAQLEDPRWQVKAATLEAVGQWPQLDHEILEIFKTQFESLGHCYREGVIKAIGERSELNHELVTIGRACLKDNCAWYAATKAFGNRPELYDDVLSMIRTRIEDCDRGIRKNAIASIYGFPKLIHDSLDVLVPHLIDKDKQVREAAALALRYQPELSQDILEAVMARAEDEDEHVAVRKQAIIALLGQKQFSDNIANRAAGWLRSEEEDIWSSTIFALERQLYQHQPSREIAETVAAQLGESQSSHKNNSIINLLRKWPQLSEAALNYITMHLNDNDYNVRTIAASAFHYRPRPKDNIIKAIVAALESPLQENRDLLPKTLLLQSLADWHPLDDSVLYAAAKLLGSASDGPHDTTSEQAGKLFQGMPQPKDEVIDAIAEHLESPFRSVRINALRAIRNWSRLNDGFIVAIVNLLESEHEFEQELASDALINQTSLPFELLKPHMESMYKALLQKSFKEHIYWLTENAQSFIVVGTRKVELKMTRGSTTAEMDSDDDDTLLRQQFRRWRQKWGASPELL
ncbi:armadillo-type protein [Nemania sp. NC0429]|nr:armadillo-type protein [Nemania sp. NC0429]